MKPHRPRARGAISNVMSAVRATGNRAEVLCRRRLWRLGFRYRLYARSLVGRPDLVLRKWMAVLFVDGDFWHGRVFLEKGLPALRRSLRTSRREWWVQKILRNVARDREVSTALKRAGWTVIRVWERDVLKRVDQVATRVKRRLRQTVTR